jgi:hypothetical protein
MMFVQMIYNLETFFPCNNFKIVAWHFHQMSNEKLTDKKVQQKFIVKQTVDSYVLLITLCCFLVSLHTIEQVAWNESSLLPKNILKNTQTLQLFTKIMKTGIIYTSN